MKNFNKVLLIINSEADENRRKLTIKFFKNFYQHYKKDENFFIKITEDEESIKRFTKSFSSSYENSLIIACGGDGTVHEVVNSMNFENSSLAIIPNGTGNDLATFIYESTDLEAIFSRLENAKFKTIDLIKVNDKYCINVASFGYESVVLDKAIKMRKKYPKLGKISYKLAIPLTISKVKPIEYKYSLEDIDGKQINGEGSYLLSAICNGKYFGKGFTPNPKAVLDDGIIEFNHVENLSLIKLAKNLAKYKDGSHVEEVKESHNYRITKGSIIPNKTPMLGNIDGELYNFDKIDFEIVRNKIRIMQIK